MKNTNTCPKCQSNDIIQIEGGYGLGRKDPNCHIQISALSYVPVNRFVCGKCGFTEEWIVRRDLIDKIRKRFS